MTFHASAAVELAGAAGAPGDGEDPLDPRSVGADALVDQPAADGVAGQILGERRQHPGVGGDEALGGLPAGSVVSGQDVGGPIEKGHHVAAGDVVQER